MARTLPPTKRTRFPRLLAATFGAALVALAAATAAQAQPKLAPLINTDTKSVIPGQYIVVFASGLSPAESHSGGAVNARALEASRVAMKLAEALGGKIGFVYRSGLVGFSLKLPAKAVTALRAIPGIAYVEADQRLSAATIETLPMPSPYPADFPAGIDRTSERLLPLDNRYTYGEDGNNVTAYVIDTGINSSSNDFTGRLLPGVDEVGGGTNDCAGHGTHVAGTIGGTVYGIAKQIKLVPVRVLDCGGGGNESGAAAGVDWVTADRAANHAGQPAVANMSLTASPSVPLPTLNAEITASIASGITYMIAAGNYNADACTVSPSLIPSAITVASVDPRNDTRASDSDFGTCVDLFGPGVNIRSDWIPGATDTNVISGTSMATPHVTGVAALWLQNHPGDSPAAVLAAIHNAADVMTPIPTAGWAGLVDPGTGSPNELLHWGSVPSDGYNDGDPHLVTVDGTHYNFQGAGEFIALRGDGGLEIQTRQTPVATSYNPGADPYDGLASCVSLNTALAARVNAHRITFEPNISGDPDPSGMQLRIDGVLKSVTAQGFSLGGGTAVRASGSGIEIDFSDGTVLLATPTWWPGQSKWYLNVHVLHTLARRGLMGALGVNSWLPALPNGASVGPMPSALHQRFVTLNQTFANAWRVSNATSLFDYKPGTSTATFTLAGWPAESGACVIPHSLPVTPSNPRVAEEACRDVDNKTLNADCRYDVLVTGETGFAKAYLTSLRLQNGTTRTIVTDDGGRASAQRIVTFAVAVTRAGAGGREVPAGTVQFTVDGERVGEPVKLDGKGQAKWQTVDVKIVQHKVVAIFLPAPGSSFLPSSGLDESHMLFAQ